MSDTFATSRTVACPASLFMGFPRQEYWSELPFPSPGDLPDPGIESSLLHWQAGSLPPSHPGNPFVWTSLVIVYVLSWSVPVEDSHHLQCLVFRSAGLPTGALSWNTDTRTLRNKWKLSPVSTAKARGPSHTNYGHLYSQLSSFWTVPVKQQCQESLRALEKPGIRFRW